jgi:Coenzyme PQQ synthesis protein D (PqqD)
VGPKAQPSVLAQRSKSVISERFDDETLVLEPTDDRYVRLNATGSRLWELLQAPIGLSELAGVLAAECHLDNDRAQADVLAFVSSLADRGLIELTPSADPRRVE